MNLEDKIEIVKNILKDKKVAVGFSGGADSTLIAYLASKVSSDVLAITIVNVAIISLNYASIISVIFRFNKKVFKLKENKN